MTENITQTPAYRVAFSMYVALGGDKTRIFDSVDAIYDEIDKFYGKGSRITTEALNLEIIENISELYNDEAITGYKPVSIKVNVPQKYTDEQVESLVAEATLNGYNDGYVEGEVAGVEAQKDRLIDIEITQNGTYTREDGYENITVTVDAGISDEELAELIKNATNEGYQDGYSEGLEDGAEDQKALLEAVTFTENGTYTKEDGYNEVTVAVEMPDIPTFETEELSVELTENGTYNYTPTTDGYSKVDVIVNVASSGGGGETVDFSMLGYNESDWNSLYNIMLDNSQKGINLYNTWDPSKTSVFNPYGTMLFPKIDTSNVTTMSGMLSAGSYSASGDWKGNLLIYMPMIDTSKVTSMYEMFSQQKLLKTVPHFDTSNVTNMGSMFYYCDGLVEVPLFDTSNVTNMSKMFYRCHSLKTVPHFDTSNVTNMRDFLLMDSGRYSPITEIPLFDTSNVTTMSSMLSGLFNLKTVPHFNTSNVTTMYSFLAYCNSITTIPQFDTSNVTDMGYMLNSCRNLESIPLLEAGKVTSVNNFFGSYDLTKLSYIGGFKDLGKASSVSGTNNSSFLYRASYITEESIMNIINNLYDRASAGLSTLTLKLNSRTLAALNDEQKAIATAKGWTLSS